MQKIKFLSRRALALAIIIFFCFGLRSQNSKRYLGKEVQTPELHEITNWPGKDCQHLHNDGWCYLWVDLEATALPGWTFVQGTQQVLCTRDNQGSAAWNGLPFNVNNTEKFQTTFFSANLVRARVLMQSRSITIALSVYANQDNTQQ